MVPSSWAVRRAEATDLDGCVALALLHEKGTPAEWHARFESRLAAADTAIYVAVSSGTVIGYARVASQSHGGIDADPALPDGLYLCGVAVAPERRREGIGAALCTARIEWALSRASELWFFTNVRNVASRALHRSAGFVEMNEFAWPDLDGGRGVLGRRQSASAGAS